MIAALARRFAAHRGNAGLLAVLLDAEGPHFSFGASVEEHLPERCAAMLARLHALLGAMLEWPRADPGGGARPVPGRRPRARDARDSLIFAAPDAKLGQPEIQLGVFAPAASCCCRCASARRAPRTCCSPGRSIDARQRGRLGPGATRLARRSRRPRRSAISTRTSPDKSAASLALRRARGARALRRPRARAARRRGGAATSTN